ncbi:hypothetical protein LUZ61_020844 [Rhynchospora tenuis]|uniref:Uncharacterized protein n=1 Tax=Rhynchospora tenuis TaxID=198213 RepID=A0AAD6EP63_9POAL|nr:hypothetical protein LUZ61_020844 [Rhynchospora tenuis]
MEEGRKVPCIGIDLGTAYTRASLFDGTHCRIIPDDQGNSNMPSYVAFTGSGVLIGKTAKKQAMQNTTNTIFGSRYSHSSVRDDMRLWPFKVIASQNNRLLVEVSWKGKLWQFTPVEICSIILTQIIKNAEKHLRATITNAVITVPVQFNYEQRQAIKEAGMISGLNFMQIINAPSASALFYSKEMLSKSSGTQSISRSEFEEYNMFIFDFGAGALDISLITLQEEFCLVRATAGNVHLGGSDFDNNMVYHVVNLLKSKGHKDVSNNLSSVRELRTTCEHAKALWSSGSKTVQMMIGPNEFSISAETFNELNKELFLKCIDSIDTCLRDAKMSADMVDEVILVGASTRIPTLQAHINQYFKGKAPKVSNRLETAPVYGAALQAYFLISTRGYGRGNRLFLLNAMSFSLGIQSPEGVMVVFIPKGTTIPTRTERICHYSNNSKPVVEIYEGEGDARTIEKD